VFLHRGMNVAVCLFYDTRTTRNTRTLISLDHFHVIISFKDYDEHNRDSDFVYKIIFFVILEILKHA